MGKTGSVNWNQVKGAKGQIRLVPQKDADVKKPGPNQRFRANSELRRLSRKAEGEGRRGGGPRGGRSSRGRPKGEPDKRLRRHVRRAKISILGLKGKAKK
jgi:hypothetical protein